MTEGMDMQVHMEVHPAASLFPLMDGLELNALVEDIRAHGLLEQIVTLEGKVLDGRNRLHACGLAGLEPSFREWQPQDGMSPTEYVVSHNLHRRHLSVAQRAALALDLLPRLEEEARERSGARTDLRPISDAGRSDEKAAQLVGVGRSTVATTKAIQNRDETGEVVDAMRSGELNVSQAQRAVGLQSIGKGRGGFDTDAVDSGERGVDGRVIPVYYGRGDPWEEVSVPLKRYLSGWNRRGFEFGHVNPRDAKKRVVVIDMLVEGLLKARADLEPRSHKARSFTV